MKIRRPGPRVGIEFVSMALMWALMGLVCGFVLVNC